MPLTRSSKRGRLLYEKRPVGMGENRPCEEAMFTTTNMIAALILLALVLSGVRIALEWQRKVDMRTITVNVEPQETITKDSVTIKVNAVLWYRVTEPFKAILEVADFRAAVYQVALTSLRNIIGQHALDEVLKARDQI